MIVTGKIRLVLGLLSCISLIGSLAVCIGMPILNARDIVAAVIADPCGTLTVEEVGVLYTYLGQHWRYGAGLCGPGPREQQEIARAAILRAGYTDKADVLLAITARWHVDGSFEEMPLLANEVLRRGVPYPGAIISTIMAGQGGIERYIQWDALVGESHDGKLLLACITSVDDETVLRYWESFEAARDRRDIDQYSDNIRKVIGQRLRKLGERKWRQATLPATGESGQGRE